MKLLNRLKQQLPKKYKRILQKIYFFPKHYGFTFVPGDSLASLKKKMNLYYSIFPAKKKQFEQEIDFINKQSKDDDGYTYVFPYPFSLTYDQKLIEVFKDETNGLYYVMHFGKRLYYNKNYDTVDKVQYAYRCIQIEQDANSPHRYINDDFTVKDNDIVLDIGAAEGNFALEIIEKVNKVYLFEPDATWINALEATFKPWKEKVVIVNKYVSNYNDDNCISLDVFLEDTRVDFMKMDVEGYERQILDGAKISLKNKGLKLAICTYHHNEDSLLLEKMLQKKHFSFASTDGYMLLIYAPLSPPYFRKGLLRAKSKTI